MEATSKRDFAYAMTPIKVLSWSVGTWPLQKYNVFAKIRAYFAITFLTLMVMIIYAEMFLDYRDAEKSLDAMVIFTSGILAIAKVYRFHVWPENLIKNFVSASTDYNKFYSKEKRAILRRHAYMGRMACASLIGFAYFSATLFSAVAMLVGKEEEIVVNATEAPDYPIPSELVLELVQIPKYLYFIVFVMEYLMLIYTSNGNLGSDSLFLGITFHLCGQVEVLKMEIIKLTNENERTSKNFKVLVERHIYLMQLAKMLIETISWLLVFQLFSSCVLICTSGFQFILALSAGNVILTLKTFMVMSACLVQLFGYSYTGHYLKNQMESVGHSTYFSAWYDLPREVAKSMIYVIMRAQDPVELKAGSFFVVNMETYMSIIKTSMSYLSVLRVMVNS
ncbi:odorant receptor 85f-like isoform X1 [Ceratina calcarata]|uniref:Odorant receptor n=2 Tax=Ceratina calcarata TaxID=156304 RepID=A0AAJ7ND23_9HYME|nr:odorant receptor 85f-like isoform X1 [Ceratina calcarata]